MKKRTLKITAQRGDLGFTAIEIAMVAAVIAILSLIVLPIFRNRVEDAKISAAMADLSALMKAEQVVKADVSSYARLEDLDNVELNGYTAAPTNGVDKEVPFFRYLTPVDGGTPAGTRVILDQPAREQQLAGKPNEPIWRGPYIAFQNSLTYADLKNTAVFGLGNFLLRSQNGGSYQAAIQDVNSGELFDSEQNRYPVDPWGNPYMFFAPTGNAANPNSTTGESPSAVIYSMGPNGQPGDGSQATIAAAYTREFAILNPTDDGALGKDDDLMVEF